MKNVIIFASGSGSNAENIIHYFNDNNDVTVNLILSNNPKAYVLERAKNHKISAITFNRTAFYDSNFILDIVKTAKPDLIVLAGFLWKFPENIINAFPNKIINIHPALLPKYGGKGMYGAHVHEAVVANKETESGITIHYVNEHYDDGVTIFQASCEVLATDTADDVAKKVHELEYEHFPKIIDQLLSE
ncbi:phosphoribosylglycinamide formyltransferase-1 [Pustulibacterium marinum]|uniref:Phosphoribosylglycinamide formyltransferase n=1 Tax=Pustulibacterium marinum TaxID=1224947 RepID=A0A1I7ESS5_9FLAO|nr:phosphoribosylglycinamide formyltransferase [Pustulibacterium marinum]SFU26962.1 phosphoribosylglycinamide formyltransferase-1 [Pustulibacterium marinum]